MAAVSLIRNILLNKLVVSVTKRKLEEGIFLSTPFKVVTTESVFAPAARIKLFKVDISAGSHAAVTLLYCITCPDLGSVLETATLAILFAFQIAAVVSALIVQVVVFGVLVIFIDLPSPFICKAPTCELRVVTPLLNDPKADHTPACLT